MTEQDIRLRRLTGQYLSAPAPAHTVARALCGFQAQYPQNALHALSIRTDGEGPAQARLVKSWTLRGTIHLFPDDDLPVYLGLTAGDRFRCNEWSAPSFWNQRPGWALTPARQAYFTDVIVEALSRRPLTRDTLREHCRARGMTEDEAASMFDFWGGGLRELCERGFVCYTAGPEKALRLCPPLEPLSAHAAHLTLARRYFTHYAPATIHDAMYFFHASAKAVRGWLAELPVHSAHCSGREYFWLDGEDAAPASPPECRFLAGFDPLMLGYEKKESLSAAGADAQRFQPRRAGRAGASAPWPRMRHLAAEGRVHPPHAPGGAFSAGRGPCVRGGTGRFSGLHAPGNTGTIIYGAAGECRRLDLCLIFCCGSRVIVSGTGAKR